VHAWEQGASLTPDSVMGFTTCIRVAAPASSFWCCSSHSGVLAYRRAAHSAVSLADQRLCAVLPPAAGAHHLRSEYEVLRAAGKKRNNRDAAVLSAPGHVAAIHHPPAPDAAQCEVAVAAMRAALELPQELPNIRYHRGLASLPEDKLRSLQEEYVALQAEWPSLREMARPARLSQDIASVSTTSPPS
jgi:uncharacterized protein YqhQ